METYSSQVGKAAQPKLCVPRTGFPNLQGEKPVLKLPHEGKGLGAGWRGRGEGEGGGRGIGGTRRPSDQKQSLGLVRPSEIKGSRKPHSSQQPKGTREGNRDFMKSPEEQLVGNVCIRQGGNSAAIITLHVSETCFRDLYKPLKCLNCMESHCEPDAP